MIPPYGARLAARAAGRDSKPAGICRAFQDPAAVCARSRLESGIPLNELDFP
jgi:hypothetical protein